MTTCTKLTNIDELIGYIVSQYDVFSHDEERPSSGTTNEQPKTHAGNGFSDDVDDLIKNGVAEPHRSEAFARVVWSRAGIGHSPDEIESELRRFPQGIANKFLHPRDRLRKEVDRCYDKRERAIFREDAANGQERDSGLPQLVVARGNLTATAQQLAKIFAENYYFLSNGNTPVMVVVEDGVARAIAVTPDVVRIAAHELCRPVKPGDKKGEFFDVTLSPDVARLYLFGMSGKWGLSPLHGITTAPILEDDGSIRIVQGYDIKSGLYCHNVPQVNVLERPNVVDAGEALFRLRGYLKTFPFADSVRIRVDGVKVTDLRSKNVGMDESSAIAQLMTAVARQSIALAPGALADAPELSGSGTGKGLLIKFFIVTATGIIPVAMTGGHNREELDKRLVSALVEARPAMFLDNYNDKELSSETLASALTENPAMVRILGQTKTVPLFTRTFVGITGNGVQVAEDLARRMLKTHLDAEMENPEQRPFATGVLEFLERVRADRNRLLSDVLTIWRWGRQNALERGRPLGGFEIWSRWCRDPLVALGCRDPVDRIAEIKAADPRRVKLTATFDKWRERHKKEELKASDLHDDVLELIDDKSSRNKDGALKYNRNYVASFLQKRAGTRVGGYALLLRRDTTHARTTNYFRLDYGDDLPQEEETSDEEF